MRTSASCTSSRKACPFRQGMTNDEIRSFAVADLFVIRGSTLIRHSSFELRHCRRAHDSTDFLTDIKRRPMPATNHTFTLGIEEEFAIVDPVTRELRSHIQEILEGGKVLLKEQIKPEMHQSVVELGTEICTSIDNAREHVIELRSK